MRHLRSVIHTAFNVPALLWALSLPVLLWALSLPIAASAKANAPAAAPGAGGPRHLAPFAVVELFTSEGCSSCPPADDLLATIARQARASGRHVYALAFHVDYWDALGWKDPFDNGAWTQRQQDYATTFGGHGMYTPQMVINGAAECVGSREDDATREIEEALAQVPLVGVTATLDAAKPDVALTGLEPAQQPGALQVAYVVREAPQGALLSVALVEDGLSSRVLRGENRGKTLMHERVVRALSTRPLHGGPTESGQVELAVPSGVDRDRTQVIVLVQQAAGGRILGATAARQQGS